MQLWNRVVAAAWLLPVAACSPPTAPQNAFIDLNVVPTSTFETNTGPRAGRIANYYLQSRLDFDQVAALARYDILIVGLENMVNNPDVLDAIRAANPNLKLFFYVASNEFPLGSYESFEPPDGPWHTLWARLDSARHFLQQPNGLPAEYFPGTRSYNLCDSSTVDILAAWVYEQFAVYPWDGVFYDNVWGYDMTWYCQGQVDWNRDGNADDMADFSRRWISNLDRLGRRTREYIGPKLMVGNVGGDRGARHDFWTSWAEGRMFEGFPNTLSLPTLAQAYLRPENSWRRPGMTIVHAEANEDTAAIRFAWYFTLLGNGAFAVDHGPNPGSDDSGFHDETRWYPELYGQPYGRPVTWAFMDRRTRVWLREYEGGLVIWNPQPTSVIMTITTRLGDRFTISLDGRAGRFISFDPPPT